MHRSSPQSILGQRRRRRRFHRESIWLCNEICLPTLTKIEIEKVSFGLFVAKLTILVSFSVSGSKPKRFGIVDFA